ncbi:hypothetical protein [Marinobacter segnicrescens]|uniref:Uncharacterized protein n=1 Tax=Marinobacter segnicrescens TaxID=430453 RepID=A0A1I0GNF3_9GAMM|nr:hypothetical protein [Marinobacter segnicrescens]SET71786.1 hypothetical protein SAMN04487962_11923 [Marinobacter segnicrescens]
MTQAFQAPVARLRSLLAYIALLCGVLSFVPGAMVAGAVCVVLAVLLAWRELRLVARMLFALVVVGASIAALVQPAALFSASENMTRLSALILTVMLLSSVLGNSRDLLRISGSLFSGQPLARYYSLAFGTGLLSVPLNFGSVGVVGSLIGHRIREKGDSPMTRNAVRAVLRGFAVSPICSPLSISVVMTVTFLPGLQSWELIALSLPLGVLILLGGAWQREEESRVVAGEEEIQAGLSPWLRFAGIISLICAGVFSLSGLAGLSYSRAVTLSCFAAVVIGFSIRGVKERRLDLPTMAPVSNELIIVGGSAFIGALISMLALRLMGDSFAFPGWAFPLLALLVPWVFYVGGTGGFNPIVIGTLVGGVLGPLWPPEATLGLGIAMVSGWGITAAGSPYAANSLLMERLTGYPARQIGLYWNFRLSMVLLVLTGGLASALTAWLAG